METRVYRARTTKPETKSQSEIRPFRSVVLVESLLVQGVGVPACVVGAVVGEEEDLHLALVGVRSLQGAVDRRNQVQVEDVDRAVASSVVVDVDPCLGVGLALLRGGAETSDRDLVGKLEDGWLGWGDPRGLARQALDRSFRRL